MEKYIKSKTLADNRKPESTLNLLLRDFGKQSIVDIQKLVTYINSLPLFHLEDLNEILYDPERYTPQILNNEYYQSLTNTKGIYIQSHKQIVIFEIHSMDQLLHLIFHELGHHVYFKIIKQATKMKWVKDICRNDKFITEYASRNAAEDFAESYASYLLEPDKLKQIPLKYNFLRKHVFEDVGLIMSNNKLDYRA